MLIFDMMEKCQKLTRNTEPDLVGSYTETWTAGNVFSASIIKNSTTEAIIAEKQGIKELFTVVVRSDVPLAYHDVFKRLKDNAIFQVTSESTDSEAPARSTVKITKVTAERMDMLSA